MSRNSFATPLILSAVFLGNAALAGPNAGQVETGSIPDPARISACFAKNTGAINFIVTRALMPKPSMDLARFDTQHGGTMSDGIVSADGMANPIVLKAGSTYVEIRTDGLQHDTTRKVLTDLCTADPTLDLPGQLKTEIMAALNPPESLIDIENRRRREGLDADWQTRGAVGHSGPIHRHP